MRSDLVVVTSIVSQDSAQMSLAQDDKMIHALASDRSDQPFGKTILPRRGWCSRLVPDTHGTQSARDDCAVDFVSVANEVLRGVIPRKCLCYLARNPFCRRVGGDVDPDEVSAIQAYNDKRIEQVEADGRGNEQVHRGNVRRVVTQKGAPSLARWPASFHHVLGNTRLSDRKTELEQFAVDARCAPKRVLDAHPPDQRTEVRLKLWPPS